MRLHRMTFTLLTAALAATACAGGNHRSDEQGPPAAGQAARQELTVGFTEDQSVLEGPRASLGAYPLNANIVETLTYMSPDFE